MRSSVVIAALRQVGHPKKQRTKEKKDRKIWARIKSSAPLRGGALICTRLCADDRPCSQKGPSIARFHASTLMAR